MLNSASKSTSKFNKSDERPSFGQGPTAYNNASMVHYNNSVIGDTSDILLHDISITSPSTLGQNPPAAQSEQTPETLQKAKLRLETVCLLLAENGANSSASEKGK